MEIAEIVSGMWPRNLLFSLSSASEMHLKLRKGVKQMKIIFLLDLHLAKQRKKKALRFPPPIANIITSTWMSIDSISRICCANSNLLASHCLLLLAHMHTWYCIKSQLKGCPRCEGWRCLDLFTTGKNRNLQLSFGFLFFFHRGSLSHCIRIGVVRVKIALTSAQICWWGGAVVMSGFFFCKLFLILPSEEGWLELQEQGNRNLVTSMNLIHIPFVHVLSHLWD